MKKQNMKKQIGSWLNSAMRTATAMGGVLALALLLAACGNNSGNSSPVAAGWGGVVAPYGGNFGGVPTCAGCPTAPQILTTTLSRGTTLIGEPVEMGLNMYGDARAAMQSQMMIGAYYGPFAATGYLYAATSLQECGLPAGRFALQTASPGLWGNDGAGRSGENLMMTVVNSPIPIFVYLSGYTMPAAPAAMGSDGRMYPYSFTTTTMQIKRADASVICTLFLQ
jgi:hypothetical protein